jgi:2-polyprenyl-3-methyl-5-hydroxy-6-metoxy-1,4-benzoquinol methylase
MLDNRPRDTAETAAYYDDAAVSRFYESCWGGSDIHIGLYATGEESVAEASAAMTRHLLERTGVRAGQRVLDVSCGFGGTLRTLARMGCHASGIDIASGCVERAKKANADAGLDDVIDVRVGDFHSIDSDTDTWDAVICQESIIHSPARPRVFAEVFRILRPGGSFGFSDILTAQHADLAMVEAAFARLGAAVGATPAHYRQMARGAGFDIVFAEERLSDIRTHYDKLAAALARPIAGLDEDTVGAISSSIASWRQALAGGHITWACFVARKPTRPRRHGA